MDKRIRKRGIKASRVKLEIAMLNAGIKTQTSLADKIAKRENLSSPPKDTINRVFREEFVSPTTITRIAKILLVDPGSLYLTLAPEDNTKTNSKPSHEDQKKIKPLLGKFSLALISINPEISQLTYSIHQLIKKSIKSVIIDPQLLPDKYMSVDIVQKYQADGVLTIRSHAIGRYQSIQVFLYFNDIEQLIWTDGVTGIELKQHSGKLAKYLIPVIRHITELSPGTSNPPSFETIEVQDKYLQARLLLEQQPSEGNLNRAQSLLLSALKSSPDFARAQAALAKSYITESWQSDTKHLLEEAQEICNQALTLAPDDSYVLATLSHLFRITGRIPESIHLCKKILETQKDNIDAISGLSDAYIEAYNQDIGDRPEAKNQAIYYAEKAVEIEPEHWKHHFELGNNRFLTGKPVEALSAYEASVLLNPQEIAYINLGVMYLCQNELSKAQDFFKKAHELYPGSYLGYEYLGSIFYFSGEYNKSIEYRKKALEFFPDKENIAIHEMWAALADAYRHAGNQQKAIETYSNAIHIIERDKLQGYSNLSFKVHHYYYFYFLSQFQPDRFSSNYLQEMASQLPELIDLELNPGAYAKLAHLLFIQGNYDQSTRALKKATAICPLFYQHPDIKPILHKLGFSQPLTAELNLAE